MTKTFPETLRKKNVFYVSSFKNVLLFLEAQLYTRSPSEKTTDALMILHGLQTRAGVFLLGVDLLCTVSLTKHVLGTVTV